MAEQKLEISMDADPIERLKQETEFTNNIGEKRIGEFLLEEFAKDEILKQCYFDRKVTLKATYEYIKKKAKEAANGGGSIMIDDETVYGWAIHYVQDGNVKEPTAEKLVVTREVITEEDREKAKKDALEEYKQKEIQRLEQERRDKEAAEKARLKKLREEEKKKREESGQMSLFDLGGDEDA